jgi:PTS system maltose and glucose-specific IIC component
MLGNVTEPLEFSFLFIAPLLYGMYAFVLGLASVALALLGTAVGYIRGTIFDFAIFGVLYESSNWINIVIVGLVVAVTMYFMFKWFILKFDVKTPGREESPSMDNTLIKEKRYAEIAKIVVEALGGKKNIVGVDNCITRLRIDLVEVKVVDRKLLESSGCAGIFFPSAKHIHIVYGPLVEFVRNAVDDELKK